jgi:6-phosphogluconolactonase
MDPGGLSGVYRVRSQLMTVEIYADPKELAQAASTHIGAWLRADGNCTLGLAGGSTPRLTYEYLQSEDVPWDRTHTWLTDERHVPLDHPESNGRMALESLISHIPARFHPVPHHQDPEVSAAEYEETLDRMWDEVGGSGRTGLMLLGLGDDGHTASLFPGTTALDETERSFVANWVEQHNTWRLTATPALLASADRLLFLVAGDAKAAVVAEILEGDSQHPGGLVSRSATDAIWMLDRAAASRLNPR